MVRRCYAARHHDCRYGAYARPRYAASHVRERLYRRRASRHMDLRCPAHAYAAFFVIPPSLVFQTRANIVRRSMPRHVTLRKERTRHAIPNMSTPRGARRFCLSPIRLPPSAAVALFCRVYRGNARMFVTIVARSVFRRRCCATAPRRRPRRRCRARSRCRDRPFRDR